MTEAKPGIGTSPLVGDADSHPENPTPEEHGTCLSERIFSDFAKTGEVKFPEDECARASGCVVDGKPHVELQLSDGSTLLVRLSVHGLTVRWALPHD
jgi:hypothetical protein